MNKLLEWKKRITLCSNTLYRKWSEISNILLLLFSTKMLVIMAGFHKMLARIAKEEDPDQAASSEAVSIRSALFV